MDRPLSDDEISEHLARIDALATVTIPLYLQTFAAACDQAARAFERFGAAADRADLEYRLETGRPLWPIDDLE